MKTLITEISQDGGKFRKISEKKLTDEQVQDFINSLSVSTTYYKGEYIMQDIGNTTYKYFILNSD